MPSGAKAKVVVQVTPTLREYLSTLDFNWPMIAAYGIAGLLVTVVAVITGLKVRSSKDDEKDGEYSKVVQERRASLAEYERRSSVMYSPEEEAVFLEADRKRAKGKALEYKIAVDEMEVTRMYDDAITTANDNITRAIVEGTSAEGWNTQGVQSLSVLCSDEGDQVRCSRKCEVPAKNIANYLSDPINVCLGGHEGDKYRYHDIATVEVPIKAPVITASEVPEPHVVAIGKGVIRRWKCKEQRMFASRAKRDYLVMTVTYQLPSTEDGDGSYVILHTSIAENEVTSLSDAASPPASPRADLGSSMDSPRKGESAPDARRSIGDLVFHDEEDEAVPATPTSTTNTLTGGGRSPITLHHKDEADKKAKLGVSTTKSRGIVPFSGFVVEANETSVGCNVHFACLADKADSVSADVKIASLENYFKKMSSTFESLSGMDEAASIEAIGSFATQVRTISGEVASIAKVKTPEEIMEEQRERDEVKFQALMDRGPVLAEQTVDGVLSGYSAVLRLHDYLDLPRDYLAEKSFLHNCPPGVKKPRRRRMSVMQMVGLEEVPDTPEMMKLSHTPRSLPKLDFVVKAQSQGVVCASAEVPGSTFNAVRATSVLKVTKKEMVKLLLDDSRVSDFDDMLDSFTILTRISPYNAVKHMRFKPIFPTSGRDFVVCSTWEGDMYDLEPIIVAATSFKDELADPKDFSSYVRGSIPVNGYLIEPFESIIPAEVEKTLTDCKLRSGDFGPGHVKVTFINHLELNGSLPSSVINSLSVSAPVKLLRTIESVLLKDRSRK